MNIKNVKINENSFLFKEEAEVIIAVIRRILEKDNCLPKRGSFCLNGIDDNFADEIGDPIITFDFGFGAKKGSRQIVKQVVEVDLETPHLTECNGISRYGAKEPLFLSLYNFYGRFSAAIWADGLDDEEKTLVYSAIAKAISLMSPEDLSLQNYCQEIIGAELENLPGINLLVDYVYELFATCKLEEIKAWKKWYEANNNPRSIKMYFQK